MGMRPSRQSSSRRSSPPDGAGRGVQRGASSIVASGVAESSTVARSTAATPSVMQ
jgi:hypothetical protein